MSPSPSRPELPLISPERPAPPPRAALLRGLDHLSPVPTRRPLQSLLVVVLASLVVPLGALWRLPWRGDLEVLPAAWLILASLLWLAGFLGPLTLALLPARGQVLPNEGWAGRAALLAATALPLLGLFTFDAPGRTVIPERTWADFSHFWWHCISFSLKIVAPVVLAGLVVLARVLLVGAARLGAAIGAAAGALAGLTLHALCPIGGALHVVAAHGGAVLVGAALGLGLFPLVRRLMAERIPSSP